MVWVLIRRPPAAASWRSSRVCFALGNTVASQIFRDTAQTLCPFGKLRQLPGVVWRGMLDFFG